MLLRLILLILVVFIAYQLIRKFMTPGSGNQKTPNQFEAMVSCSHCGLHLPKKEALLQNGRHYCSKEHAIADDSGSE